MSKSSYLERALTNFIRDKVLGGFKTLVRKDLLPFTIALFISLGLSASAVIVHTIRPGLIDELLVKQFILLGFLIATTFVVFGLFSSIWKNYGFQLLVVYIGITLSIVIVFVINPGITENTVIDVIKMLFLVIWVIVSSYSMFFIIFYLFTGLEGKLITSGKSDDHVFLLGLIRIISIASIILGIRLILQDSPISLENILIGGLVIIGNLIFLVFGYMSPKNNGTCNFITIIGIFNIYNTYHLSAAINPATSAGNVFTEFTILIFTAFYYISSKTNKISGMDDDRLQKVEEGRTVFFQQRILLGEKSKKVFGELALILMSIGLAFGYSLIILNVIIDDRLPFVGEVFSTDLGFAVVIHRLYVVVSFIIMIFMIILFSFSPGFREFSTNKYNFKQGVKIIEDKVAVWGKKIGNKLFGFVRRDKSEKKDKKDKKD